jgi:hypothetical protein
MEITVEGNELSAKANTGNKQWVAVITGTHPQYNYEREFVAYQKPKTSNRDSGSETVEDGAVVEYVRYTHSGKNRSETYYQVVNEELHQIDEDDIEAALEGIVVEVEEETHECEECGDEFKSEHGLAIHKGMVHTDEEEEEDETPAEQTNNAQEIVADGGVEYEDYEIDPTELEYEARCKTYDGTNSRTNYLGKLKNSDIWVAYRTWQTGPSETSFAVKGVGRLSTNGVSLDTEQIADSIRERATTDIRDDRDEWGETDEKLSVLVENADEVAAALESGWQWGAEEVVHESIIDGYAGINQTTAWVSHVEEAYSYEVEGALRDADVDEDSNGRVSKHTKRALSDAVAGLRNSWLKPHLEYQVSLDFEVEPWELRALELHQNGVFRGMMETARVQALRETGKRPSEIADVLDVNPSTVTRHKTRADEWLDRSDWTVKNVTERGVEATR